MVIKTETTQNVIGNEVKACFYNVGYLDWGSRGGKQIPTFTFDTGRMAIKAPTSCTFWM